MTTRAQAPRCRLLLLVSTVLVGLFGFNKMRAASEPSIHAGGQGWWCDASVPGRRCTDHPAACSDNHAACERLRGQRPLAVMLSDRVERAAEVTLRSLCRQKDEVDLLFVSTAPQVGLQPRFESCRLLPLLASDVVRVLEARGFAPRSVCTLDRNASALAAPSGLHSGPTLVQPASRHIKHALCLNHLRFFLAELPLLAQTARIVLLDDDVVVRRSLRHLLELPLEQPGTLLAANCDTFAWSRRCVGWSISHENYSAWFGRSEHGLQPAHWAPLGRALQAPIQMDHTVWNFGATLLELKRHREHRLAARFERVAAQLLTERVVAPDSLLYGLGVAYLVYQGKVQCFGQHAVTEGADGVGGVGGGIVGGDDGHGGWVQLDGLGHIPIHEMIHLVGARRIERAAVLHYTGERKPWMPTAFFEYAPLLPPEARPKTTPRPLDLVLLLHDGASADVARAVSEGFVNDSFGCASYASARDRRLEPHPDALMPFGRKVCVRYNRTGKRCARRGWVMAAPPIDSCQQVR